jgi:hypothetical protein
MKYEIVSQSIQPFEFLPESIVMKHLRLFDNGESDIIQYYMKSAISFVESRLNVVFRSNSTPTVVKLATNETKIKLRGLVMFNELIDAKYYNDEDEYYDLAGDQFVFTSFTHPYLISVEEKPSDLKEHTDSTYIFQLRGGMLPSQAPLQVLEAILLLVGHYYNQREAEHIGGITSTVKEGVDRLLISAKKY